MKPLALVLFLALARLFAADSSIADITFVGVMTISEVPRVVLTDAKSGRSSEWIRLGRSFEGFAITSYDSRRYVLTLTKEGKDYLVPLAKDAKITSGLEVVKLDRLGLRVNADAMGIKDGVRFFHGNVSIVSKDAQFSCNDAALNLETGALLLTGSVKAQVGDSVANLEHLTIQMSR